jgi:hypothetical protein
MTELHKAQADGIIQAGTDQQHQARNAPDEVIDGAIDTFNNRHKVFHITSIPTKYVSFGRYFLNFFGTFSENQALLYHIYAKNATKKSP